MKFVLPSDWPRRNCQVRKAACNIGRYRRAPARVAINDPAHDELTEELRGLFQRTARNALGTLAKNAVMTTDGDFVTIVDPRRCDPVDLQSQAIGTECAASRELEHSVQRVAEC